MAITVVNFQYKLPEDAVVINTTSRSSNWSRGLSPFFLGPIYLYDGFVSKNIENAWCIFLYIICYIDKRGQHDRKTNIPRYY